VRDQLVDFLERAFVHQQLDALARCKFPFLVLPLLARLAPALCRRRSSSSLLIENAARSSPLL
jgi:hypothetical protein